MGSSQIVAEQSYTLKQFLSFLRQATKKVTQKNVNGNIHNRILIYVSRIFNSEIRNSSERPCFLFLRKTSSYWDGSCSQTNCQVVGIETWQPPSALMLVVTVLFYCWLFYYYSYSSAEKLWFYWTVYLITWVKFRICLRKDYEIRYTSWKYIFYKLCLYIYTKNVIFKS